MPCMAYIVNVYLGVPGSQIKPMTFKGAGQGLSPIVRYH